MKKVSNTPAPKGTDRWQWIAIGAIVFMFICGGLGLLAYIRSIDVVTSPEREAQLQAQIDLQATQMAEMQASLKATLTVGPVNTVAPANTETVTNTLVPVIPATPTATSTPIPSSVVECYFAGARMTDGHVPGATRNGGAGRCDVNALINSVSMQAFWEEVVTNDTQLPVGLKRTDVAPSTYEPGNDFPRAFAINNNGTLSYFVPDASEGVGLFPFWWTSCVKYNVETNVMTFYKDDSGNAGGFDGTCTGTWKEFDGKPATAFSGETLTYIKAIQDLAEKGYTLPSQPYVFDVIWFEAWPPQ
jgi:hypothetical protein